MYLTITQEANGTYASFTKYTHKSQITKKLDSFRTQSRPSDETCVKMNSASSMESLEQDAGGRTIQLTTPNPRRTPPRNAPADKRTTQDGRKRQKLSYSPEKESHRQVPPAIGDEVQRVLPSQKSGESGSSDQSAGRWFAQASRNATSARHRPGEFNGMSKFMLLGHAADGLLLTISRRTTILHE